MLIFESALFFSVNLLLLYFYIIFVLSVYQRMVSVLLLEYEETIQHNYYYFCFLYIFLLFFISI